MLPTARDIHVDIVIIGGGVAGLWLLNRLRNAGYHAVLFEQQALGAGQTVASQGMIHGGVKYTLGGALSGASETIAEMPSHWRQCLAGTGDVDLRGTRVLSEHFYMWSSRSALSKVTAFLASKALRGRVDALKPADYPEVFRHPGFRGDLYKLVDMVIDAASLLETLRRAQADYIFAIDWRAAALQQQDGRTQLSIDVAGERHVLHSELCVLAAGKGNGELLRQLGATAPAMQLRPLQQVMVRHRYPYALFAHCVGTDSKPRLTISSHAEGDAMVWYLGGQLAEEGVGMAPQDLLLRARAELTELFPWLDWREAEWAVLPVDRAEPAQPGLLRPDNAWLSGCEGVPGCVVAWPTKLTLVPNLGNLLLAELQRRHIEPDHRDALPSSWPRLETLAAMPWQNADWQGL